MKALSPPILRVVLAVVLAELFALEVSKFEEMLIEQLFVVYLLLLV